MPAVVSPVLSGKITSIDLLAALCLTQLRMPLAFLDTKAHCWLMFHLISVRAPRSFPAKLLSSWVPPACLGTSSQELLLPNFAFHLVELHEVPVRPFLQTAKVSLEVYTHWCTHHPSQFCIICTVVENALCPLSWSLMKMLNGLGSRID